MRILACAILLALAASPSFAAGIVVKGDFRFRPLDEQTDIPARYRLAERSFSYEMERKLDLPAIGVTIHRLRFPSPITSPDKENNTVHAEYYRPNGPGPFPAAIVLDITGGSQLLSRHISTYLADNGVAALFVQMAYYGPRRPLGSRKRLLSPNVPLTIAAVTQTVLDLRVAAAWLASRAEIDANRLGITGTSLGSFVSALAGEMEPRLDRVCVLLGGGGFVDGYADHPMASPWLRLLGAVGASKDKMKKTIAPIDPITCAANLKKRKLLILAASKDEIVPPRMAQLLWEASGRQTIGWYDAGHYTAILHIPDALARIAAHLKGP